MTSYVSDKLPFPFLDRSSRCIFMFRFTWFVVIPLQSVDLPTDIRRHHLERVLDLCVSQTVLVSSSVNFLSRLPWITLTKPCVSLTKRCLCCCASVLIIHDSLRTKRPVVHFSWLYPQSPIDNASFPPSENYWHTLSGRKVAEFWDPLLTDLSDEISIFSVWNRRKWAGNFSIAWPIERL